MPADPALDPRLRLCCSSGLQFETTRVARSSHSFGGDRSVDRLWGLVCPPKGTRRTRPGVYLPLQCPSCRCDYPALHHNIAHRRPDPGVGWRLRMAAPKSPAGKGPVIAARKPKCRQMASSMRGLRLGIAGLSRPVSWRKPVTICAAPSSGTLLSGICLLCPLSRTIGREHAVSTRPMALTTRVPDDRRRVSTTRVHVTTATGQP